MNGRYLFLLCIIKQFLYFTKANDVLGCGGFIKSHVPIDFSKIEVKLVTKQGIVKDRTNCAPNNGYYFVPIYDKGEYKLELSPPPGWSFTPKEIAINIDGRDLCSLGKDINFVFQGFGITGKVESLGDLSKGPPGVLVKLESKNGTRITQTNEEGAFSFSPVFPGSYVVSISHSRWKIHKDSVKVDVTEENTELPKNSLIIQGYDVTGKILTTDGSSVQNTIIALFAKTKGQNAMVEGCEKNAILGITPKELFLCYVTSSSSGEFVFPVVPSGSYLVAPYYKTNNIDYQPKQILFSVEHSSLQLNKNFQVIGFTIPGRVIDIKNKPIPEAKIFLNENEIAKTDKLGKYKLEKLKIGTYRLSAKADNVIFDEKTVNIDPNLVNLPDLIPSALKVCGKVVSDKPQTILFKHIEQSTLHRTESNDHQQFCHYLPYGHYEISVEINNADIQRGLQFFPLIQKLEVLSSTVNDLVFSQLKSSMTGRVKCIQKEDCNGLNVILKGGLEELVIPIENSLYLASDIHPGDYEVFLSKNELCWESPKHFININSEFVEGPSFIHTGYPLRFISSHETKVTYKTLKEGRIVKLPVGIGVTDICLDSTGQYTFSVNSCHEFDSDTIPFKILPQKNQITLIAKKHTVEVSIKSDKDYGPVQVNIRMENEEFRQIATFAEDEYEIRLMLKPFELVTLTPKSDQLFFSPRSVQIEGTVDCSNLGHKLVAVPGKVFQGETHPPLAGVTITVEDLTNNEVYTRQTDSDGRYKFLPLDGNFKFKISAQKESYVFTGPSDNGDFFAQKLAEITVEVLDEDDRSPLMGVLLSLSGGQSFRRNLQTDSNGRITFHSLGASDYFLRPMMKEYRFEPTSKLITLKEGETINIVLMGKRVAFSAFGKLTSINQDPVENVNVIAAGTDNCTGLTEEATTDASGMFRIRGLQPFCNFKVYVQVGSDFHSLVERTNPESIEIKNINHDAKDLHIIVFRPVLITDVLLKIYAEKVEHYRFLKITLYRESVNPTVLYSTSVDSLNFKIDKNRNYGILIHLPSLQLDNNDYSVHLEASQNVKSRAQVEYFTANSSFKYIQIDLSRKTIVKEQPIKQSSIWAMLFILVVLMLTYNIQFVSDQLKQHLNFNLDSLSFYIPIPSNNRSMSDYDNDIDQIVQDINNVRRHRPKKTN